MCDSDPMPKLAVVRHNFLETVRCVRLRKRDTDKREERKRTNKGDTECVIQITRANAERQRRYSGERMRACLRALKHETRIHPQPQPLHTHTHLSFLEELHCSHHVAYEHTHTHTHGEANSNRSLVLLACFSLFRPLNLTFSTSHSLSPSKQLAAPTYGRFDVSLSLFFFSVSSPSCRMRIP